MDTWLTREIDFAQRHEELLLRREALLQGTETYYDEQEKRAASFIASCSMAEERNRELLNDLNDFMNDMKKDTTDPGTPKFNTLKNNYWTMLKNVFPVWLDELKEHNVRDKNRSAHSEVGTFISPRPPPGSPPQGRTPRSPSRSSPRLSIPVADVSGTGRSPAVSPHSTLEGMIVNGRPPSPGPRSPTRSPSPNGRPPSPDRKSLLKKNSKKSSKGGKSSKNKKK